MTNAVDKPGTGVPDAATSQQAGERFGDSAEIASLRSHAASLAATMAMPTPRERKWKYLDISGESFADYNPLTDRGSESRDELVERFAKGIDAASLYLADNGKPVVFDESADRIVAPLSSLTGAEKEVVAKHLGKAMPPESSKLVALHYAALNGGVLINVPANVEVELPVRIVNNWHGDRTLASSHTLIVTGANSRVRIIEDYRSTDEDILALPVVEIFPGQASRVEYTSLHRWGSASRVFPEQRTITAQQSEVVTLSLLTGGKIVKQHVEASMEGRGSSSEVYGLGIGDATQHHDVYTIQDHIGPETRSDLLIKSALEGKSRAVYYGLTRVGLQARRSDANQENRNLLLSKQAKADSDPVLEILTNDVLKCAHGATAGPVDEEQLYYLQTRGIPLDAATDLLVWAFLSQVLDRVPDEALREELADALRTKLEAGA
jgi:Fe-S cluster assembly protein SufD